MNDSEILRTAKEACQIAKSFFNRGKNPGSAANLSFRINDRIFITASGTCFGNLTVDDFVEIDLHGNTKEKKKPSKEFPLHLSYYNRQSSSIRAVIHTHSFYSTLWSCLSHDDITDVIPAYTPYLTMKLGKITLVPYATPGSPELFSLFDNALTEQNGYLLAHHGPIVGADSLSEAMYALEELEESSRLAWELRNEKGIFKLR